MPKVIFITGTDTACGKTVASAALSNWYSRQGFTVKYCKPFQTGPQSDWDAPFVHRYGSIQDNPQPTFWSHPHPGAPYECTYYFGAPKVLKDDLNQWVQEHVLPAKEDIVLVEGCGGLKVPLLLHWDILDFIDAFPIFEVVLVSSLKLGTLNHTQLSIKELSKLQNTLLGVLYFGEGNFRNMEMLEELTGVNTLGRVFYPNIANLCSNVIHLLPSTVYRLPLELPEDGSRKSEVDKQNVNKTYQHNKQRQIMDINTDINHIWRPFTQMAHHRNETLPLISIKAAKGVYLYDQQDRALIDGVSSWWTSNIGHCHPKVVKAIQSQAAQLDHVMFAGFTHEPAQQLTQTLIDVTPKPLTNVFFSDDGSTAVETALKIAIQYWKNLGHSNKSTFLKLSNAYHGDTVGAMSLGDSDTFHHTFNSLKFPTVCFEPPEKMWCEGDIRSHRNPEMEEACVAVFRDLVETHAENLAGFFLEPLILGAGGMKMYTPYLLETFTRIAKAHNLLVVYDEVMTGFGRTGQTFAMDHLPEEHLQALCPDIICLSKGITGGTLPLGVTMMQSKIAEAFLDESYTHQKTFFHGHSYTANPIVCRAAHTAIQVLQEEHLVEHLQQLAPIFKDWLDYYQSLDLPIHHVRHLGGIFALEVTPHSKVPEPFSYFIFKEALKYGALIRPIGHMAYLMPPLCIQKEELGRLFEILEKCLNKYFKL